MRHFVISIAALLLVQAAHAACVRLDPDAYRKSRPAELDGPGSFGKLQDTVTLDCLRYAGSITKSGKEYVLIKDELGQVHTLSVGSYMGEHTGQIVRIDPSFIYLRQMIEKNGNWVAHEVKFRKMSDTDFEPLKPH